MKTIFFGVIICLLLMTVLPIMSEVQLSQHLQAQISDSYEDYQEIQLLPDVELNSNYETYEIDYHDAFEANSLSSEVELLWAHQDGDMLDIRDPVDITNNLPECEEYVYVSESFTWDYNVLPTITSAHLEYSINLAGDFDSVTYPQLFKVYGWIIDSSGEWTLIYSTYSGATSGHTSVNIGFSYYQVSRAWGGAIENNYGVQTDPTDTFTFAVGLGPTYTFSTDDSEYWNWMNGLVQVIVDSMSLTCVVNPTPDEEETLTPDFVSTTGSVADEITRDIAVSEEGNVYSLGSTYDNQMASMTITKWDAIGTPLWTRSIQGSQGWTGSGVAISESYVVAVGSASTNNETDTLIAKWNHQGVLIWNKTVDLGGLDSGMQVDIAHDGSLFVTGIYMGDITTTAYFAKFSSNGTLLWSQDCGYPFGDYPRDIAVAFDGYIYTATYLTIAKWDFDGIQQWNRTGVFSSVKATREGNLYTTNLLTPRNLLQQWWSDGTKGWNISLTYNHTYAGEIYLYPVLLDVTEAGWAYVKLTSAQGLGKFVLAIFDTAGLMLWNQTMDPSYFGHPYINFGTIAAVDTSGFVCFASSVLTSRGDLDSSLQIYLSDREPPLISSPLTIAMIVIAICIIVAIPLDFRRRRRTLSEEEELPEWMTTQVYLRS